MSAAPSRRIGKLKYVEKLALILVAFKMGLIYERKKKSSSWKKKLTWSQ